MRHAGSVGLLIDVDDCFLCVIDVQPGFLDKVTPERAEEVVQRIRWLTRVALAMEVPLLLTEEEPAHQGSTIPSLVEVLPDGAPRFTKHVFGLADQADIAETAAATGRDTAVLCGLETDVCVAQSALGLMDRGFRVVVVADAVASPGSAHEFGLGRMRDVGVVLTGCKPIVYEWLRTVELTESLDAVLNTDLPPGLVL